MPEFDLRPAPGPAPASRFQRAADRSGARSAALRQTHAPARHARRVSRRTPSRRPRCRSRCFRDLRPLGQIHESFIIAAGRDGLWIIDQHVAHERILFEQVMKQRAAGRVEMQRLLMPMIVQLTPEQQIDYARIADELHASGFETEPFGNRTIAVKAAPAAVGAADLEKILFEILEIAETRAARRFARRSAPQHLRLDRLPRRHQDQHAARCRQDGVAAARARGHGLPDELPARPPDRDALLHARDPEGVSPDLTDGCTRIHTDEKPPRRATSRVSRLYLSNGGTGSSRLHRAYAAGPRIRSC